MTVANYEQTAECPRCGADVSDDVAESLASDDTVDLDCECGARLRVATMTVFYVERIGAEDSCSRCGALYDTADGHECLADVLT